MWNGYSVCKIRKLQLCSGFNILLTNFKIYSKQGENTHNGTCYKTPRKSLFLWNLKWFQISQKASIFIYYILLQVSTATYGVLWLILLKDFQKLKKTYRVALWLWFYLWKREWNKGLSNMKKNLVTEYSIRIQ